MSKVLWNVAIETLRFHIFNQGAQAYWKIDLRLLKALYHTKFSDI